MTAPSSREALGLLPGPEGVSQIDAAPFPHARPLVSGERSTAGHLDGPAITVAHSDDLEEGATGGVLVVVTVAGEGERIKFEEQGETFRVVQRLGVIPSAPCTPCVPDGRPRYTNLPRDSDFSLESRGKPWR